MTTTDYIKQLSRLCEIYGREATAELLGVTVRSLQNYLSKENPSKPSNTVIRKIGESFMKANEGVQLKKTTLVTSDEQVVRNLSESVKNLTQSNQANAENLKTMLRIIEANSGAPKVASLIDSPSFHSLLDVIAKVVVQEKKFHSVDEFRAFAMKEIALHSSETK